MMQSQADPDISIRGGGGGGGGDSKQLFLRKFKIYRGVIQSENYKTL